jgi:hypothetical protein
MHTPTPSDRRQPPSLSPEREEENLRILITASLDEGAVWRPLPPGELADDGIPLPPDMAPKPRYPRAAR